MVASLSLSLSVPVVVSGAWPWSTLCHEILRLMLKILRILVACD